jgi:hypothetical protein
MNFIDRLDKLEEIAWFIKFEKTGNLNDFATECGLTKDALFDQIEILRQLAARESVEIIYDRRRETYYFNPRGYFVDFKFIINETEKNM